LTEQPVVTVVDYGAGNRGSVTNALRRVGARTVLASTPQEVLAAERLVLPGVGAFDTAAERLWQTGLAEAVTKVAGAAGAPVLGVCLGMHLLADASEEGSLPGLGLVAGVARRLEIGRDRPPKRIPHVGWAALAGNGDPLLDGIEEPRFYFSHSYRFTPRAHVDVVATATYGCAFPAIVRRGRVWGAQFHPEKSGRNGMRFLRNFLAAT
jgi:imidazole glycerol-phosphate synthase subunit HisH